MIEKHKLRPELFSFDDSSSLLAVYISQAQPSVRKGYFVRHEKGKKRKEDLEKEQIVFLVRALDIVKSANLNFSEVFKSATEKVATIMTEDDLPLHLPEIFRSEIELLEESDTISYYEIPK